MNKKKSLDSWNEEQTTTQAACLQAKGSMKKLNTFDVNYRLYVNCGSWNNGSTDFVVVCNGDIIRASWLFPKEGSGLITSIHASRMCIKNKLSDNKKVKEFFDIAHGLQRGYIVECWKCPHRKFRFTEDDDLHIFIGDCHINLFREWSLDNFIKNPPPNSKITRTSLISDFSNFINVAGKSAAPNRLIQVGDLYEYWEAQNLYEYAADVLVSMMESYWGGWHRIKSESTRNFPPNILSDPTTYNLLIKSEKKRLSDHALGWLDDAFTFAYAGEERIPKQWIDQFLHLRCLPKYFGIDIDDIDKEPIRHHNKDSWKTWKTKWIAKARHHFWKNKPTPRDVLALLYYGDPKRENRGMSAHTSPETFPETGLLGTGVAKTYFSPEWSADNHDHFRAMVNKLKCADTKVDFLNYTDLKDLIKGEYGAELFQKFSTIQGNHDMEVPNDWLEKVFKDGEPDLAGLKETLTKKTKVGKVDRPLDFPPEITTELGKGGDSIYLEHGHAWDPENNPKDYFLLNTRDNPLAVVGKVLPVLDGGYHACLGWTVKGNVVYDGDFNDAVVGIEMPELWKDVVTGPADAELERACEQRMNAIFSKPGSKVKLVVMGHTHLPKIEPFKRALFFWV